MSYETNSDREPLVQEKVANSNKSLAKCVGFALLAALALFSAAIFAAACLTATAVTLYVFVTAPQTILNFGPFLLGSLAGSGISAYHLGKFGIHYLDSARQR